MSGPGDTLVNGGARRRPPAVRVQFRSDNSVRAARWTFVRVEQWAVPIVIALVILALGMPSDPGVTDGYVVPGAFALGTVILFVVARRLDLIAAAAIVLPFAGAFAFDLGDASLRGVMNSEIYAGPDSVAMAIVVVLVFLGILVIGSGAMDWGLRRLWPIPRGGHVPDPARSVVSTGLALTLLFSFLFSLAVGAVVLHNSGGVVVQREGGLRWEFLYEPALLSAFTLTVDQLVRIAEGRAQKGRIPFLVTILGILLALLFLRQVRRLMALVLVIGFFQVAWNPVASLRWLGSIRRVALAGVFLVGLIVSLNYASVAWRESINKHAVASLADRIEDTAARVNDVGADVAENARARLDYVWVDSASVEYQPLFQRAFSLPDLFIRSIYAALPGALVPVKYRYPLPTCETAFELVHLESDLPCTPTSEGYIAFGMIGVIIVALSWVPVLGLASYLLRRRTAVGIIIAMHLLDPLCVIETSAFPQIIAARCALLGAGAVLIGSVFGVVFFGWGMLSPRRRSTRTA